MHRSMRNGALLSLALLLVWPATMAAGLREKADVVGQAFDGRPVVAAEGATLLRTTKGLSVKVAMPTPAPGSYVYPDGETATGIAGSSGGLQPVDLRLLQPRGVRWVV